MRIPGPGHIFAAAVGSTRSLTAGITRRQVRVLALCGLAVALSTFDGSLLFLALPRISIDFRARMLDLSNLGSIVALGSVGTLVLSTLADRSGRRRMLVLGTAAFSIADVVSALAPNLAVLAAVRVTASCFEGAVLGVAAVMVVEEMPPSARALAVAVLTLATGVGSGATLLGYPLLGQQWRPLYALGVIGLPASVAIWRLLPESGLWLASPPSLPALRRLLGHPWRARLVILAVAGGVGSIAYGPGGLFVALFGSRDLRLSADAISIVFFAAGVFSAPGYLAGGWLSDRFGRRAPGVLLSALSAVVAGLTFVSGSLGYEVGNVLWGLLGGAASPVLTAWFAELFPTRARVTAEAVAGIAGTLGGILGLQLVGRLGLGLGPSLFALTVAPLLGAFVLLKLPETGGRALPE